MDDIYSYGAWWNRKHLFVYSCHVKVTVRSLLEIPNTGLVLLSGAEGLDSEVRWVHVSDVRDPTPWLQGGEFVLTTAVRLISIEQMVEFVKRLHEHGIAGIGFGTGGESWMHAEVPREMREVAEVLGIPLIEVPFDTPFIVIAEFVAAQQAAENFRVTQLAYRAQQELTQIALSGASVRGLVARIAELTSGWASVFSPNGRILEVSPQNSAQVAMGFIADLERVRETGTALSITDESGGHVSIHPLGAPGRVRGMLMLGQKATPSAFDRMIAASAESLLSFVLEQLLGLSPQRMAAANLLGDTLLDPKTPRERFLHAAAGLGLSPSQNLTLARLFAPNAEPGSVMRILHDVFSPRSETSVIVQDRGAPGTYTLITVSGPASNDEFERLSEHFGQTAIRAGISEPTTLSRIQLAYNQASLALSHAQRERETPIVHFYDLQYYDRIAGLAPPGTVSTFVTATLSPLERVEPRGRSEELIETLRVFLDHHGRWDPAARQLGVHRQTLIKRIARIEQYLDVDLESADIRMGLWFALAARAAERPAR